MIRLFTCIFIVSFIKLNAQVNLVPNSSFEEYNNCPDGYNSVHTYDNYYVADWVKPTSGTSDYFNVCAPDETPTNIPSNWLTDYLMPRTGSGYAGIITYAYHWIYPFYREYLQIQLKEPLIADSAYFVEFWLSTATREENPDPADIHRIFTSFDVGMHLSETRIVYDFAFYDILEVEPQIQNPDTNYIDQAGAWQNITAIYTATGNEEWITIGNFHVNLFTDLIEVPGYPPVPTGEPMVYLFVDDVVIAPFATGFLKDTSLCIGEPLSLTAYFGDASYLWNTGDTTSSISVSTTGNYWCTITNDYGVISDTCFVNFIEDTTFTTSSERVICFSELPLNIVSPGIYDDYLWSNGTEGMVTTIYSEGAYYVEGHIGCNLFVDTIYIVVIPEIEDIEDDYEIPDTLICEGDFQIIIEGPDGYDKYLWNTGDTTKNITIDAAGTYSVTYSIPCYQFTEYFTIYTDPYLTANINLGNDLNLCDYGGLISLDAGPLPNYLWNSGSTNRYETITTPGIYSVSSQTDCRVLSDTILIYTCNFENHIIRLVPTVSFGNVWLISDSEYLTGELQLSIYSLQGLVSEMNILFTGNTPLDFTLFAKGYYLVKVTAGNEIFWFDMILQ